MSVVTAAEKLQCAERELSYRRRVYARLVERGKMSEQQRVEELRLMEAIRDDYRDLTNDEAIPLFIETKRTVKEDRS
jgi:hypothetical protein